MRSFVITPKIFQHAFFKRVIVALLIGMVVVSTCGVGNIHIISALYAPLRIMPDNPPRVSMTAKPSLIDNKTLHIAYTASDDSGIAEIVLCVTPHDAAPGADNTPVRIPLPAPVSKNIVRGDSKNLTALPWAGQRVTLQIVATNLAGKNGFSEAVDFNLPERSFFHPLARALVEEREKLMQRPDDDVLRSEAANIMADIAHGVASSHGDPVVLMALRGGAVRLVLEHSHDAVLSVNTLLWQTATRIEDGATDAAKSMMRDIWQDLADR